jgi:hypothetical protein
VQDNNTASLPVSLPYRRTTIRNHSDEPMLSSLLEDKQGGTYVSKKSAAMMMMMPTPANQSTSASAGGGGGGGGGGSGNGVKSERRMKKHRDDGHVRTSDSDWKVEGDGMSASDRSKSVKGCVFI